MPKKIWRGAAPPAEFRDRPITQVMAAAMEQLKAGSMERFRVGWAHDVKGPFFEKGTIEALWKRGYIDFTPMAARAYLSREGFRALADWRANAKSTEAA